MSHNPVGGGGGAEMRSYWEKEVSLSRDAYVRTTMNIISGVALHFFTAIASKGACARIFQFSKEK